MIDRNRCRAMVEDREVQLTPTEYRLLCAVAAHRDQVVPKKELAETVWGAYDPDIGRTLDVHMRRLRAKLTATSAAAPKLETVRSFGYRMVA
jgi:DNA-binding response OmpR family regulator